MQRRGKHFGIVRLHACMCNRAAYTCAAFVRILQRSDDIFSFQLHTLSILMNMKARLLKA